MNPSNVERIIRGQLHKCLNTSHMSKEKKLIIIERLILVGIVLQLPYILGELFEGQTLDWALWKAFYFGALGLALFGINKERQKNAPTN